MFLRRSHDLKPFVTKDQSIIREFFHPLHDTSEETPRSIAYSIALAVVKPGKSTLRHLHRNSAEFYYITKGLGLIQSNSRRESLEENTLIYIPPGTSHKVTNTGKADLHILCICDPCYSHEDTDIIDENKR
jgi:mannose-6-phosphate isomerase-like protein (cupin superfamily)